MAKRKIKPEVLRPLILAIAILIALFVLQFWRPVPPDIRQQQLQGIYGNDLKVLYTALQQYQQQYETMPADWANLAKIDFPFDSIKLPDQKPDHPTLLKTPHGQKVENMPFELLEHGRINFAGSPTPLVSFRGTQETGQAFLYSDGTVHWGRQ